MKCASIALLWLVALWEVSANHAFAQYPQYPHAVPSARSTVKESQARQLRLGRTATTTNIMRKTAVSAPTIIVKPKVTDAVHMTTRKQEQGLARLLMVRGGTLVRGQEVLTFGQNLAGSVFSTSAIMYGLACGLAPLRAAHFFYGYNPHTHETIQEQATSTSTRTGKYLVRLLGSLACGLGLTATFAIGSELQVLGHMPSLAVLEYAIGIGLVPRFVFAIHSMLLHHGIPSTLRIRRKHVLLFTLETAVLMYMAVMGRPTPAFVEWALLLEVAFCALLSPVLFFQPSVLFRKDLPNNDNKKSKSVSSSSLALSFHDTLFVRLVASYMMMSSVLMACLTHPSINALPSVGLTALTWVVTLIPMIFFQNAAFNDDNIHKRSLLVHMIMISCGLAVAAGGLRHYLIV
eukprot:CAMPEP_0198297906 /NCGR_PEP_ID=MMETSP1449-20131203/38815_1 /TAXON_ID=420275 /ORGANISM="Attheya septentrionalis, Strain CCMP2084" /LENGTH=403 /DNA_ID=CAMNT_0043999011 /DNA_START=86 /DNA_END=1297 /DNA_ORIENTATION=+